MRNINYSLTITMNPFIHKESVMTYKSEDQSSNGQLTIEELDLLSLELQAVRLRIDTAVEFLKMKKQEEEFGINVKNNIDELLGYGNFK